MRCINCGITMLRIHRHLISSLSEHYQRRLSRWITNDQTQLPPDTFICDPCFYLLNSEAGEHERLRGHNMVCLGCGKSVRKIRHRSVSMECPLLANLLSQNTNYMLSRNNYVCHVCWMRANRRATLDSSQHIQELEAVQYISSENEDTCYPQNNAPVADTAERIQEDQTKVFIIKVFHYLEHEFEVLKKMDAKMILINLSKLQYRTAMAMGVSETTVLDILQEEARRNAAMREMGPQNDGKPEVPAANARMPRKRRRVCKKQNLKESSSEASDGDIEEIGHSSVAQDITIEPEGEMLVVKAEPFEYYNEEPAINIEPVNATAINKDQAQKDPISLDVKSESPIDDEMNVSDETRTVQPASSKRRRISRKSDLTSTDDQDLMDPVSSDVKVEPPDGEMNTRRTQAEYCATGASTSHRRVIELDGRSLLRVGEVKVESENEEEGFS